MKNKRTLLLLPALAAVLFLVGCDSESKDTKADASSGATGFMLSLDSDVTLREGKSEDGAILLDSTTMEGFFASDHYTDEQPYGFALVLTGDGKKQFRTATRQLAKSQECVTLWADGQAICSPTITTQLNTKYVILDIASVTDEESYQEVVDLLHAEDE